MTCASNYGKWSNVLTGIRQDREIFDRTGWEYVPNDGLKMNLLMFGIDSLSRNTFIRKLPKTYGYLTEILNGHVLKGYNIVGDGTPQALIPILTGKTELELPDTRNRVSNSQYVNVYPLVWNDFRDNGYVTGFLEDTPSTGIFTYRLKGFDVIFLFDILILSTNRAKLQIRTINLQLKCKGLTFFTCEFNFLNLSVDFKI